AIAGTDRHGGPVRDRGQRRPAPGGHDGVIMFGDWLYRSPYSALTAVKKRPAKPMAAGAEMGGVKPDLADNEDRALPPERPRHPGSLDLPGATRGAHLAPHYQRGCVDLLPVAPRWASARYHTRRWSCGGTGHGRLSADGNGGDLRRGCDAFRLRQLYAA